MGSVPGLGVVGVLLVSKTALPDYSKAAIRYSQGLTKASMFMGLRAMAHRIGLACARHQMSIDFEVGRLIKYVKKPW